ncbi:hypothetical protein [Sulfitobacter sp. M22]|uniref:hypothetical protein n=1 Tax=Sulfitobacter sp. M22 TaxID=2675332 RepID=UPI001F457CEA|nr:hypothetical protein [Sulfitobacter sp. M22]MCF7727109.1 hypothetical protein [Sulfitobacter sp. M22]
MSPLNGELTAQGLNTDLVLPFLLVWYGWLSEEQGNIAKKRGLIVIKKSHHAESIGVQAYLTKRGMRRLRAWLIEKFDREMAYSYATYLKAYGKVTTDPWYVYGGTPLGRKEEGLDWFHSKENGMV